MQNKNPECSSCTPVTQQVADKPAPLHNVDELRDAFNADKGKVRIVTLVSPTCGPCNYGATVVQKDVLESLDSKKLAAYVVWIPMLLKDNKTTAEASTSLVSDPRALQYWDGDRSLGKAYGKVVKLPNKKQIAWDVYFDYGPDAVWGDAPPIPKEWMHQLGDDDRCLNPDKLHEIVKNEVSSIEHE